MAISLDDFQNFFQLWNIMVPINKHTEVKNKFF